MHRVTRADGPIEITHALGNGLAPAQGVVDILEVEWYETSRSRMKRKTRNGLEVLINKTDRSTFQDGDILFSSEERTIILKIKPCDCIVLRPASLQEVGTICFEIGNKHIPIFITDQQEVCVAYDAHLFQLLMSGGFGPEIEERILFPYQMIKAYGNKAQQQKTAEL